MELYLDEVPQREEGMTAYEMMLSESQERMLFVVEPKHEAQAKAHFRALGLALRESRQSNRRRSPEADPPR